MAFDAIETTVANALLLKAQMGETEPIVLKTKPFSELTAYTEKVLAELTLSNLLQEPLGKYCFNKFLAEHRQDALLQICIDIRMLRTSSGKSKRMRGLKIVDMLSEGTARTVAANNSSAQAAPAPPSASPFKGRELTFPSANTVGFTNATWCRGRQDDRGEGGRPWRPSERSAAGAADGDPRGPGARWQEVAAGAGACSAATRNLRVRVCAPDTFGAAR